MDEVRRLGLTLFMSSPLQREAWSILSALPARQRTEAICLALCRAHERDAVMDMVRQVIREDRCAAQHGPKKSNMEQPRIGDVGDDVLDFLRSLQDDGGEDA